MTSKDHLWPYVRWVNFYPPCDPQRDPHPWRTTSWVSEEEAKRHALPGVLCPPVKVVFYGRPS